MTINEVLALGHLSSVASARVDAKGRFTRSSRLTVGRTLVAGQVVEITPEGVRAADQVAPLPESDPAEALAAAGVQVRYLKAEETPRGVLSAGIEVIARQRVEGATYEVRYTLGRTFAAASESSVSPHDGDLNRDLPATATEGIPVAQAMAGGGEEPVDDVAAAGPSSTGADSSPDEAPQVAEAPQAQSPGQPRLASNPVEMGLTGLYLAIVLAALAMFTSATLLRLLGVKTRWTS